MIDIKTKLQVPASKYHLAISMTSLFRIKKMDVFFFFRFSLQNLGVHENIIKNKGNYDRLMERMYMLSWQFGGKKEKKLLLLFCFSLFYLNKINNYNFLKLRISYQKIYVIFCEKKSMWLSTRIITFNILIASHFFLHV